MKCLNIPKSPFFIVILFLCLVFSPIKAKAKPTFNLTTLVCSVLITGIVCGITYNIREANRLNERYYSAEFLHDEMKVIVNPPYFISAHNIDNVLKELEFLKKDQETIDNYLFEILTAATVGDNVQAIRYAASKLSPAALKKLGTDWSTPKKRPYQPLAYMVKFGNHELVTFFLEQGFTISDLALVKMLENDDIIMMNIFLNHLSDPQKKIELIERIEKLVKNNLYLPRNSQIMNSLHKKR